MSLDEKRDQYTKWANRMFDDPTGLEVIGERLGMKLTKKEELKDEPVVAVLVPSYDGLEDKMMDSASRMVKYTQKFCTVFSEPIQGSSLIPWTRNDMQSKLYGKTYTHVAWMDDDMEFEEDYLVRMLRADKDIVGCVYTTRTDPPIPNIHLVDLKTTTGPRILHWKTEGLQKSPKEGHTLTAGTGLLVYKKAVVDRLEEFYINCEYDKLYYGLPDDNPRIQELKAQRRKYFDLTHNGWWFELMPRLIGAGQCGEDTSFCVKAAMCGFEVWVDTSIQPGHIGKYTYSIKDYEPFKENQIKKAKAQGQYCEV